MLNASPNSFQRPCFLRLPTAWRLALATLLTLLLAVPAGAEDRKAASVTTFTLPEQRSGSADMSGADVPWLDTALGAVGLPGTAGAGDAETTYDKARRMQSGYGGSTRLSYGERYRRNPDGSYGAQSSSRWGGGNVADRLLEQALSAGGGYFSSWAEGWLGGYGNARIQLRINDEGDVTGAGDFLLPLYDSERTILFTQLGLRTMANDRVIGNFGLGQRFFPAENFAFGYNAFIDQDFSRNHTRGGVGLEAWYDWLRLSTNYYTPLSGWKDSEDYDSRLVEERPAEGYDARLTGYLPFYRNLAVTGAFEQWKGDHVGSFGTDDFIQKDPKVWSYGLEWTPVPAFSTSVNQRHSGGQKETQFGLTFNYHFGMDWEDQLSPAMVAEMRTVDGSRHDFVNRQNEMILAYRAKEGAYNIVLWRTLGGNIFEFRLTNGFGEPVAGRSVQVSADQGVTVGSGGAFVTDGEGVIRVALTYVPPTVTSPLLITLAAGQTSRTIALNSGVVPTDVYSLAAVPDQLKLNTAENVTFTLYNNGVPVNSVTAISFTSNSKYDNLPPSASTNTSGTFTITGLIANTLGDASIEAIVDGETVTCPMTVGSVYLLTVTTNFVTANFVTGAAADLKSTASLTATFTKDGATQALNTADVGNVHWSIDSAKNASINPSAGANTWWKARSGIGFNTYGLAWGANGPSDPGIDNMGTAPTGLAASLTDIVGSRPVTVTAGVCVGGSGASNENDCNSNSGAWYSADQTVTFGAGPLSVFNTDPNKGVGKKWATYYGTYIPTGNGDFGTNSPSDFEAAVAAGGSVNNSGFTYSGGSMGSYSVATWPLSNWSAGEIPAAAYYSDGHYADSSKLPKISQLRAVAKVWGQGAAFAAGWPQSTNNFWQYWSGEVAFDSYDGRFSAEIVDLDNGNVGLAIATFESAVAVGVGP